MKNLLQKALAGWLSVVMACGAGVPALALGSGSVTGKVFCFEGPLPPDVVEIQMPTRREGMFDFIIDPSGAIAATNGARYKGVYGDEVTFDSGNLFFQNYSTDESGNSHISYSNRSDSLIVTNIGNVPVDVEMTLEVNKGGYDFQFADSLDFTDANGNVIDGAAMYMALVSSKRECAVMPVTVEEESGGTSVRYRASVQSWLAPPNDAYHIVWSGEDYRYQLKADVPDSAFDRTSFYVTGTLGDGVWDDVGEEISMNIAWTVIPVRSTSLVNPYSTPESESAIQSLTYANRPGQTAKILVDFGSGDNAMTTLDGVSYTFEDGTSGFVDADEMTISAYPFGEYQAMAELTITSAMFDAVSWSVRLSNDDGQTVEFPVQLVLDLYTPTAASISRAGAGGEIAQVRVHWGSMTQVVKVAYTTHGGDDAEIPASEITVEDETVSITLDENAVMGSDFLLILTNEEGETAELPVDLSNYSVEPTADVFQQASASVPSASMTIDWGIGSKRMNSFSKVTYTDASGAEAEIASSNVTVEGDMISVRFDSASIKGTNFKVVLMNSKGVTFTFPVELVEPIDPTVAVTQTANADGDSAIVLVDWGAGSKAMSYASKVTYTNSSGAAAEITGDNVTTDGDTVSVKFDAASIHGTNFKLILANASGETFEADVDLVNEVDPLVTVTQKASASGDFAAMTVDWGGGSKAMSAVSKLTYVDISGAAAEIATSDFTVIGGTVSVQFDANSIKGTNFKLILTNISGATFEADVDLVNASDPGATVAQKANASGESAIVTMNWGGGSKAMSSVSKVTYTDVTGAAAEITGSNITVSGDTVSVKFDANSVKGTNFKLVLTNVSGATFEAPVDLVNASNPTATVGSKASASGGSASVTVDWGVGSKAMSSVSKVTYTDVTGAAAEITGSSNITVSGNTVSVKFDANSIKGTNFKMVLANASGETFDMDVDLVAPVDPTVTVGRKASASGDSASVTADWGADSKAMASVSKATYTTVSGQAAEITGSNISVNGNAVSITFDETSIKGVDFKLVLTKPGGATFEAPVDLVTPSDPSATVTQKATASGESAIVTMNWGVGSKAMASVSKVTYVNASGTMTISGSNITVNGDTVSVKFDQTSIRGNSFKLVLKNASGETFEIAVDLANYEEPPSANVTKKASSSGQSAVIAVTWGAGSKAMTSVSKVKYTDASGAAAEIDETKITTSGNNVYVKFNNASIQGSGFKLVLTNSKGATCELPVDLADFDPSQGIGAEADVTSKAKSAGQTATVVVDWGAGEQLMTSVSKVMYTKANGSPDSILPGPYLKTNGDVVSIKFTSITIKGTDFILVLTNSKGATREIEVDLIDR